MYTVQYEKSQDQQLRGILLQHNLDDVRGMTALLPLRSYRQLLKGDFQITDIRSGKRQGCPRTGNPLRCL